MPRVQAGRFFPRRRALPISGREVADQLIAEEVQRYPVGITPGQLAAEKIHVEMLGRVQVVDGYGQVENVIRGSHRDLSVKCGQRVGPEPEA
jgi:hypothetical protein